MATSKQTKATKKEVTAAQPEWSGQILEDLIYQGFVIPDYKIAEDGLIISYKMNKKGRPLKWQLGSGAGYPGVNLRIPLNCLRYADTNSSSWNGISMLRYIEVHRLVAETYMNIETNCPTDLEPYWLTFTLELKKILRPYFILDHIDNNRLNPHISNLKLTSHYYNNKEIKMQELGK